MNSAPNAAFRVDRSPSLCSAGRFDIIELLHGDLHRLRRPQGARHSPKASRPRSGEWSPRPFTAASGPRSRFVRPVCPSTVPTAAAGGWIAAESALERLQGLKSAHLDFHLGLNLVLDTHKLALCSDPAPHGAGRDRRRTGRAQKPRARSRRGRKALPKDPGDHSGRPPARSARGGSSYPCRRRSTSWRDLFRGHRLDSVMDLLDA